MMILNTETSEYSIFPFDADVHSGGDPFMFSTQPSGIFMGVLPLGALSDSSFAFVDLKDDYKDLLLVLHPPSSTLIGYRFNSKAANEHEWFLTETLRASVPSGFSLTTFGENQVLMYDEGLNFRIWDFVFNATRLVPHHLHSGNINSGYNCFQENATACVLTDGCAWCPTTRSCHNYDMVHNRYCDSHVCEADAVLDSEGAAKEDEPRNCDEGEDEIVNDIKPEEPVLELPKDQRLPSSYRNDAGVSTPEEASPIHPSLDNLLGDDPVEVENPDTVIQEQTRVSEGRVFRPPKPDAGKPCMDLLYDETKPAEKFDASVMNRADPSHDVKVFLTSPLGDAATANNSNCLRKLTPNMNNTLDSDFMPASGHSSLETVDFVPASTAPRREEDKMNLDHTKFSELHAGGVGVAVSEDNTLALQNNDSAVVFQPKEPLPKAVPVAIKEQDQNPFGIFTAPTAEDRMNLGLHSYDGLAGGYYYAFEQANPIMKDAMKESTNPVPGMPKTIEQQLALFKHEPKVVYDPLPGPAPENLQITIPPVSQPSNQ